MRGARTKAAWLLVVPFLFLARPTPASIATGAVLTALGLFVRAWSAGTIRKGEALATGGPYAFTRNPLYLGSFLIGLGLGVAGGHWLWPVLFVAFYTPVYAPTMAREARHLHERFGPSYREYAAHVPAFVPRLTPYRSEAADSGGFRWSRYGRYREWEALLGAGAAFAFLAAKIVIAASS